MPDPAAIARLNPTVAWPDGLTVRRQRLEDAEAIADMQSLPGFRFGTLRLPYPSVRDVRSYIENPAPNTLALVALLDGIIVGHAGLTGFQGRRSHAASLGMGVHDAYTRRGIGRVLLCELIAAADDWLNLRRLELTVYTDNDAAISLYRSLGFVQEGLFKDFAFRQGRFVDALTMARFKPEKP
ncbi:GNAT family N-acetyltransferase [Allorhizobium sp. BGMRC 0089]|uniref:GNAT family N-acetyltransferase n=1 Tax=Allorhizobium sonneratiae TaxID=2934936 RepID=UPI0020343991|nr:GNAT family N-acetyltransferase [Allorhizobium sonneratiae]MCM2294233.1 GNAT family N-acetyltransferase [Allorhizobium sonneratiae]